MSLNDTASAERIHIGFYGMRNAGKSSVVNRVTGQELSVVSDVKGTTTDPVKKAMELLPLGPVVIIDTPGLDDEGELGEKRIQRARRMLAQTDIAVLVVDAALGLSALDRELLDLFRAKKLPFVVAWNKADTLTDRPALDEASIYVSAATGENIHALKEKLGAFAKSLQTDKKVLADKLDPGSVVVLVMPIDEAAPKGRVILPQQQVLRDVLDARCTAVCCQDTELADMLAALKEAPALVVTDSQVFGKVAKLVPTCVPLTSFSILFARYRGDLAELVRGAAKLEQLRDGDRVLISEGCSHHRQCNDIGTVKMPGWIEGFTGVKPVYSFTSGGEYPDDLTQYALVVHCGGCVLNPAEMKSRIRKAVEAGVPIVNYGIAIAHMHGILRRSLEIFPEIRSLLDD